MVYLYTINKKENMTNQIEYKTYQYLVSIHRDLVSKVINGDIENIKRYVKNTPSDEDNDFVDRVGELVKTTLFEKINRFREQ